MLNIADTFSSPFADDLFTSRPPRPSAVVPGVWRIGVPGSDGRVGVRVFIANDAYHGEDPPETAENDSLGDAVKANGGGLIGAHGAMSPAPVAAPSSNSPMPPIAIQGRTAPISPRTLVDSLRSDPFERAWLHFNSYHDSDEVVGHAYAAREVLSTPCAVVRPATDSLSSSDAAYSIPEAGAEFEATTDRKPTDGAHGLKEKELWVFGDQTALETLQLEGLKERESPVPTIDIASTITCSEHGHSLSCLSRPKRCTPFFNPPTSWTILEAAVGEKLAWRLGARICLLPSSVSLKYSSPYEVSLRPTPSNELLFTARPPSIPRFTPGPITLRDHRSGLESVREPHILWPLALPALLIGPQTTTAAQDCRLAAAFEAAFGPGWKSGRSEARLSAKAIGNSPPSEWGVYFVPLALNRPKPTGHATDWRGENGVLTVWPTHLVRPLTSSTTSVPSPSPTTTVRPAQATSPDLLSTASGLYDFFTGYTEPQSVDSPEDEDNDLPGDEEVQDDNGLSKREGHPDGYDGTSDVDDLFSSHSDSPMTATVVDGDGDGAFDTATNIDGAEAMEVNDLFSASVFSTPRTSVAMDLDDNLVDNDDLDRDDLLPVPNATEGLAISIPDDPAPAVPSRASDGDDIRQLAITEDDFNFFDTMEPDVDLEPLHPGPQPVPEQVNHVEAVAVVGPVEITEAAHLDLDPKDLHPTNEVTSVATAAFHVLESRSDPLAQPVRKKPRTSVDLIPSAFAPIQLAKRRRPRFAYGLPSPVNSNSTLRPELLDRLRARFGPPVEDYSPFWDIESDSDDTADDTPLTTGAPPTPASSPGTRAGSPAPPAGQPTTTLPSPLADDEVEFDGVVCVGGEWVSLKDDVGLASTLARPWASTWADGSDSLSPATVVSPAAGSDCSCVNSLDGIDLDLLANTVLRNRFIRAIFEVPTLETSTFSRLPTSLVKSGISLSELAEVDETNNKSDDIGKPPSYTLPPAHVNVGFRGNILRISVAALRYWRELGLQPAGGPKDVEALAVCEPGEDAKLAKSFLEDMAEVYSANQLGSHSAGIDDMANEGVVEVPPSRMFETVSKLRKRAKDNTVIYILGSSPALSVPNLVPILYPSSNTTFVHFVPKPSIRVENMAPMAFEVYDMIPRRIQRVLLHGKPLKAAQAWMPYHAFTMASPEEAPRPNLTMVWPQRSYDVLNRHRQVHGAYCYLADINVLLVAAVDAEGDACTLRAIRMVTGCGVKERVEKAMEAFLSFASVSAAEWRLAVCSYGLMSLDEVEAWRTLIKPRRERITVLMVDPPQQPEGPLRPRPPISNIPPATFADPTASIIDETLIGASAPFTHRLAVDVKMSSSTTSAKTVFPQLSFIAGVANSDGTGASSAVYHVVLHHAPVDNTKGGKAETEETPHATLGPGYHRLICLSRRRYGLNASLPLHLASIGISKGCIQALVDATTREAAEKARLAAEQAHREAVAKQAAEREKEATAKRARAPSQSQSNAPTPRVSRRRTDSVTSVVAQPDK